MITQSDQVLSTIEERILEVLVSRGKTPEVLDYIKLGRGKMLRPLLVVLTVELCDGELDSSVVDTAAGVELVHTASLIHDDVIDDGVTRRGLDTVHRRHGTSVAVLAGDFLFASAFHLFSKVPNSGVLSIMTSVIQVMCTGEINQLLNPALDETNYWTWAYQKTACLLGGCCRLGAIITNQDRQKGAVLQEFGECIGLAFQLTDDVLDYRGHNDKMGKKRGTDFKSRVWTLPTIRAYQQGLIPFTWYDGDFEVIQNVLEKEGILDEVWGLAEGDVNRAVGIIDQFPNSRAGDDIIDLSRAILTREV
mgnify:FL=1